RHGNPTRESATLRGGPSAQDNAWRDRKSTRLNSSHANSSYAVFCLKQKNDERAAVDRLLSLSDTGSEATMIALAPGSVWATKRCPYFPDLAGTLGLHFFF